MNTTVIQPATAHTLVGAGLFYGLVRGRLTADCETLRPQFDGTVYGQLLSAAECGDKARLFECISQIEYSLLRASSIFSHAVGYKRAALLSDVRDFLRSFGQQVGTDLLRDYQRTVPRIVLAKSVRSSSFVHC